MGWYFCHSDQLDTDYDEFCYVLEWCWHGRVRVNCGGSLDSRSALKTIGLFNKTLSAQGPAVAQAVPQWPLLS